MGSPAPAPEQIAERSSGSKSTQALTEARRTLLGARRILVCAVVFLAIYTIIGSFRYTDWWYGFIWQGGFTDVSSIPDALLWLVQTDFWIAFAIPTLLVAALIVGHIFRRQLFKLLDWGPWTVIVCICFVLVADALLVWRFAQHDVVQFQPEVSTEGLKRLNEAMQPLGSHPSRGWVSPVYFYYVDTERINSLYNQLQPEVALKEQEVVGSNSLKAEAQVGVGDSHVGVEAGRASQQKSILAPPDFTADRKCVNVMTYVWRTWPSNYFTSSEEWLDQKVYDTVWANRSNAEHLDLKKLRSSADTIVALQTELQQLRGNKLIDGDFEKSSSAAGLVLLHKFGDRPVKCTFRVSLPKSALRKIPDEKPLRLKVFGDVTKPLTGDGFVDVIGIAVF